MSRTGTTTAKAEAAPGVALVMSGAELAKTSPAGQSSEARASADREQGRRPPCR